MVLHNYIICVKLIHTVYLGIYQINLERLINRAKNTIPVKAKSSPPTQLKSLPKTPR